MKVFANTFFVVKNIFNLLFLTKEKKIAELLLKNKLTVSTAESCTGGLLSSRLTDISGSSAFIIQNIVTYSNQAKMNLLDVKEQTIEKYGVVSEETALEMAKGLLKKYNCSIAVSTTGIAGPTGGTEKKPVGLICMAIVNDKTEKIYTYNGNPQYIRRIMKYNFSNAALDNLLEFLKSEYS